ncbi:MAG: hypothetical protein AABZ43_02980 [Planctomycetota bacterium]
MVRCRICACNTGERLCIELGDWLCPECCGQHRIIDINCWAYCPFFLGERASPNPKKSEKQ